MTAVNKRGAAHYLLVAFSLLVLSFLIAPILIIIAVSFSPGEMIIFPPQGLSLRWYQHYFNDIKWMNATHISVVVAVITALCSLLLGTWCR